jgi:SAM-dependent methyltransferase
MSMKETDDSSGGFNFYGPQYSRFGTPLALELRREVYGEDIGQQGWRTTAEQQQIAELVRPGRDTRVLDVACGSGGPALELVHRTGCRLIGLDIEPEGIAYANAQASTRGLAEQASFTVCDCSVRLPFADNAFDVVLCIDAISHLRDRLQTLSDWARIVNRGGHVIFTDTFVLTGPIAKSDLDVRAAVGFHLLVPPGVNERFIEAAGLTLSYCEDRTAAVAEFASRWHTVRARCAQVLVREEGADWFEKRQQFLAVTADLAGSRRLSRFLYVTEKSMAKAVGGGTYPAL